jgi:DNA-binding HxlR family transcriptional regulator
MSTSSLEGLERCRLVLEEITSKWSLLVLGCLCSGPMRFNALRRANEGVTQKALTQCLRRLEASGFIKRSVVSTAPVAVVYEISPLGRSLEPHLRGILKWAEDHRDEVLSAQRAFSTQGGSNSLSTLPISA